jgi:hypothetical protein
VYVWILFNFSQEEDFDQLKRLCVYKKRILVEDLIARKVLTTGIIRSLTQVSSSLDSRRAQEDVLFLRLTVSIFHSMTAPKGFTATP